MVKFGKSNGLSIDCVMHMVFTLPCMISFTSEEIDCWSYSLFEVESNKDSEEEETDFQSNVSNELYSDNDQMSDKVSEPWNS